MCLIRINSVVYSLSQVMRSRNYDLIFVNEDYRTRQLAGKVQLMAGGIDYQEDGVNVELTDFPSRIST